MMKLVESAILEAAVSVAVHDMLSVVERLLRVPLATVISAISRPKIASLKVKVTRDVLPELKDGLAITILESVGAVTSAL